MNFGIKIYDLGKQFKNSFVHGLLYSSSNIKSSQFFTEWADELLPIIFFHLLVFNSIIEAQFQTQCFD